MHDPTFARPGGIKDDQMRSTKEYLLDECRIVFLQGVITGSTEQIESANLLLAPAAIKIAAADAQYLPTVMIGVSISFMVSYIIIAVSTTPPGEVMNILIGSEE